jgi:hypothetical protein
LADQVRRNEHDQADVDVALVDLAHAREQEQGVLRRRVGVAAEHLECPLPVGVDRDAGDAARLGAAGARVGAVVVGLLHAAGDVVDGEARRVQLVEVGLGEPAVGSARVEADARHVRGAERVELRGAARRERVRVAGALDEAVGAVVADADDDLRALLARDRAAEQRDVRAGELVVADQENRALGPDVEPLELEVEHPPVHRDAAGDGALAHRQAPQGGLVEGLCDGHVRDAAGAAGGLTRGHRARGQRRARGDGDGERGGGESPPDRTGSQHVRDPLVFLRLGAVSHGPACRRWSVTERARGGGDRRERTGPCTGRNPIRLRVAAGGGSGAGWRGPSAQDVR